MRAKIETKINSGLTQRRIPWLVGQGRQVLLFENVPGGDTEVLADAKYDEDPAAFERLVLEKLRVHHPEVFERVNAARFGLTRPEDTDNFNQPERQWDILATPQRTSAFLARHGM